MTNISRHSSRKEALRNGADRYFTGKPCKRGHVCERYSWGGCTICVNQYNNQPEKINESRERAAQSRAKNPQKHREAVKRCREKNPERAKNRLNDWRSKNKSHIKSYGLEYYEKNAEELRAKRREKYAQDPESEKLKHKKWARENPDKNRARCAKRRAKKLGAEGFYTSEDCERIFRDQKGKCALCKTSLDKSGKSIDHIFPLSKGGSNYPSNLQFLCPSCNSRKKDKDPIQYAQEIGLLC